MRAVVVPCHLSAPAAPSATSTHCNQRRAPPVTHQACAVASTTNLARSSRHAPSDLGGSGNHADDDDDDDDDDDE